MSDDGGEVGDLFQEPTDYYEEPKPATYFDHTFANGKSLKLRLVGQNPLWVCIV